MREHAAVTAIADNVQQRRFWNSVTPFEFLDPTPAHT
jgi:hypothetical protein